MIQMHLKLVHKLLKNTKLRNLSKPVYSSIAVMAKKARFLDHNESACFFLALPFLSSQNETGKYITTIYPFGASQLEMHLGRGISQKTGVLLNRRLQLKATPQTSLYTTACHAGMWGVRPTAPIVLHPQPVPGWLSSSPELRPHQESNFFKIIIVF